jgi:hypothetical protein
MRPPGSIGIDPASIKKIREQLKAKVLPRTEVSARCVT